VRDETVRRRTVLRMRETELVTNYALILVHADGREEARTADLPHGLAVGQTFELDGRSWSIVGITDTAREYGLRALSAFICQPVR